MGDNQPEKLRDEASSAERWLGATMYLSVDENLCTCCGLYSERAPQNMEVQYEARTARVIRQPTGSTEVEHCTEAIGYCPTGALTATKPE